MSEQPGPAPKKPRKRKPKPTTYEQVIVLATAFVLEDKLALVKELNEQLATEKAGLEAKLKALEGLV